MKKYIFLLMMLVVSTGAAVAQNKANAEKDESYLILSTKKIQTMEKELDEAAMKGFRVLYGAPTASYDMALFLQRPENVETAQFAYKILATSRTKTMEKELNELASQGYRILPRTIIFKQGLFTGEMVSIMERDLNTKSTYQYKLVDAGKENKLQAKIETAMKDNFAPVTMITLGDNLVVMEKVLLSN